MQIKISQKLLDEKIILITIVGILESIKSGVITIEEAEKFLFSPYMRNKLYIGKCDKKIIKIIEKGCELEDIISLIPESLNESIDEIKQEALDIIKQHKEFNKKFWIEECKD